MYSFEFIADVSKFCASVATMPTAMQPAMNAAVQLQSNLSGAFNHNYTQGFLEKISVVAERFKGFQSDMTNVLGGNAAASASVMSDLAQLARSSSQKTGEMTANWVAFSQDGLRPSMALMTQFGDFAVSQGKSVTQWTQAILGARQGEFEQIQKFGIQAQQLEGNEIQFTYKGVAQAIENDSVAITNYLASLGRLDSVEGAMVLSSNSVKGYFNQISDRFEAMYSNVGAAAKPYIESIKGMSEMWSMFSATQAGFASALPVLQASADYIQTGFTGGIASAKAFGLSILDFGQSAIQSSIKAMMSLGGYITQLFTANFWQNTLKASAISTFATVQAGAISALTWLIRLPMSIATSAMSMIRMGISGVISMASYVASLVSATTAQWMMNAALAANPIGLTVLGFAAAGAAVYAVIAKWDVIKSYFAQFTAWAMANNPFSWITDVVNRLFPSLGANVSGLMTSIKKVFMAGWDFVHKWFIAPITSFFGSLMSFKIDVPKIGDKDNFVDKEGKKQSVYSDLTTARKIDGGDDGEGDKKKGVKSHISDNLQGVKGDSKITHITVNIAKLIETMAVQVQNGNNVAESNLKDQITQILLESINDVNYAY